MTCNGVVLIRKDKTSDYILIIFNKENDNYGN